MGHGDMHPGVLAVCFFAESFRARNFPCPCMLCCCVLLDASPMLWMLRMLVWAFSDCELLLSVGHPLQVKGDAAQTQRQLHKHIKELEVMISDIDFRYKQLLVPLNSSVDHFLRLAMVCDSNVVSPPWPTNIYPLSPPVTLPLPL